MQIPVVRNVLEANEKMAVHVRRLLSEKGILALNLISSPGAGKTTLIKAFSGTEPVLTEVRASDEVSELEEQTTVAMDYGSVVLDEETKVHLYGTPGQERFDFMWEILRSGSRGLIVLVNAQSVDPVQELRFYLHAFGELVTKVPVVVGVNQTAKNDDNSVMLAQLQQVVAEEGVSADVLVVDVRKRKDVNKFVKRILFSDKLFAV